jgi:hypothetical protein
VCQPAWSRKYAINFGLIASIARAR